MTPSPYAEQARVQKMAHAKAMGVDDAMISQLVERFYTAVRHDDLLGPVFAAHITDWPWHLARMKDFWASVTMESGRFHGNPMLKHINIGGLERAHFERWLMLWDQAVREVAPSPAASDTFRLAAKRIASSLLMGIENA